ncbi:MAG: MgtC/SapB family protein [Chlorobi bacterium]|nr:MgtC/SapB family protein [Chlorobiota bacterium]
MSIIENIPDDFIKFLLVTVFSLLIGLEQRRHHYNEKQDSLFGMDRTYTFIGILGFILYTIAPEKIWLFGIGAIIISVFLGIYYLKKIENQNKYGITSMISVLITYSLAPLLYSGPVWLTILVVTTVLFLTELKEQLRILSGKFDNDEFIILAIFLAMSGIILPLLPHTIISDVIPISPFKFWLVVVVVSGVSYLSYLLKKFIFPENGMIITGLLGGLYSSTATTVVLARKSKEPDVAINSISASILLATGMMFVRIFILIAIFNQALAKRMAVPFAILATLTFIVSWLLTKWNDKGQRTEVNEHRHKNPLEFKTALLFALLFVLFAVLTKYVLKEFGTKGLNVFSFIVGVTDIDPFLMSLFTGKYHIVLDAIANATLIAITSNNLIKMGYALSLGSKSIRKPLILGFSVIITATVITIFLF